MAVRTDLAYKIRASAGVLILSASPAHCSEDYKPPVARAPNPEILEHERKRTIELKILQFREAMEERK